METVLEYLEQNCHEISPKDFYRCIFPAGELEAKGEYKQGKYTAIAVSISKEKVKRYTMTDDLQVVDQLGRSDEFSIMSPISYAGKSRKSQNARFLYALAIDVDGLKPEIYEGAPIGIDTMFWQFDGHGPSNYLPKPTLIVMSGTGVHLYYVFERPIPLFSNIVKQLEKYKRRLTWQLWTQGASDLQHAVQYESLFQGFRIPGTITKQGTRAKAFVVDQGDKVTMEYMNRFVPTEYQVSQFTYKSSLTLSEAKKKYPEWYDKRIVKKAPRGSWIASRAVYDWWKGKIHEKTEDGHRYWSVMALATYAKKCGISREELESDALGMVDMLHERGKRSDNPFTVDDVLVALEAYNDSYITYPVQTISHRTGIPIQKNKRNGRKQTQHLRIARATLDIMNEDNGKSLQGRPKGSGTAEQKVREWRAAHPEGRKADCHRDTRLDPKTIRKWWEEPKPEPKQGTQNKIPEYIPDDPGIWLDNPDPLSLYYEDTMRRKEEAERIMKQFGVTGVKWWKFKENPEKFIQEARQNANNAPVFYTVESFRNIVGHPQNQENGPLYTEEFYKRREQEN